MEDLLKNIKIQNEVIISLLGRIAFPEEKLVEHITKNSKRPAQMLKAYNLCDGNTNVREIAKKVGGVTRQGLNKSIRKWEGCGIVSNYGGHGKGTEVLPAKLYVVNKKPVKMVLKNNENLVR